MTNARQGSLKTRGAPASVQSQTPSHTHSGNTRQVFFTPTIQAFGPCSALQQHCSSTFIPPLCKLDYGNGEWTSDLNSAWLQIYHMSQTVWKRKSTLPLIWKQRVQTSPERETVMFFKLGLRKGGGQDLNTATETGDTFCTKAQPT